ncbi:MAG: YidC/Oxa1 family membrane protein insertase [Clostridia bacterium]|nr:YidC/Oxa1 family membrane protein insertase [Clostridia bacterium]
MFGWLYNALGSMLAWFESWTGSYAIALLFYALIFKILLLPFAIKQQKNQIAMARLTPKIELIRAKYRGRNDRVTQQKMQQEIMELQQKEGYSPFSGCLPMLIQLPLIIFLYNVIRSPLSYITKASEGLIKLLNTTINGEGAALDEIKLISQIKEKLSVDAQFLTNTVYTNSEGVSETLSLSSIPNFDLWGMDLAQTPSLKAISWLVVIPVIAAALQWFTMWITRKLNSNPMMATSQDAQTQMSMKIMDLVFPLMTLFLAFSFSGMLGLYWIYQSVIAILQTVILAKAMPLPKYTEEEIKAMKKAQREAEKAQRAALKTQPKFRSLHYIDEDDYEELPEVKTNNTTKNNKSHSDMPEIKD